MSTLEQLELPGVVARIENGLVVETTGEDQLCGRALAIARTWQLWQLQGSKNERALGPQDIERTGKPDRQSPVLQKMHAMEALTRR